MKKLYRKSTVYPSPPLISDQLAFLPAAILTLTVALSPEDKEVLAYLLSCSSSSNNISGSRKTTQKSLTGGGDHPPSFNCNCFRCYMSYWVRWDLSPNRELIHEIIDAFEDGLVVQNKREKGRRERRKREKGGGGASDELKRSPELSLEKMNSSESVEEDGGGGDEVEEGEFEKGSVRKLVSFLGERIWSVWT